MTINLRGFGGLCAVAALVAISTAWTADVSNADYQKLKKDVDSLRRQLATKDAVVGDAGGSVDKMLENKYGPNAGVTTRQGKLTIGGLLQVWFYTISNDNKSWVDADQASGTTPASFGSNEVSDNDSFRIRRSQLRFTMDIHENVTAVVQINPAAEADSFPTFGSNLGTTGNGVVYTNSGVNSFDDSTLGFVSTPIGNTRNAAMRSGSGSANRMLEDAYISYHGILPHHDVTVGQFKPKLGEEGVREDSQLDFVERAMITQTAEIRDMGMQVHGFWWDERFQYWLGVFNGTGTAFQSRSNRSDDNDDKDLVGSILLRPLWKDELWGSIELGYSVRFGEGGESGGRNTGLAAQVDGLRRNRTNHIYHYAYAMYKPGGPVRGWWLRGEYAHIRDRFAPLDVTTVVDDGQVDPAIFAIHGWYFSTGYKMSESRWGDSLRSGGLLAKHVLEPMEFAFRYETMQNLFYQDLVNPGRENDIFASQVYTAGINYYIKGHNAKVQFNYNWVIEDDNNDNPTSNFATAANGRQTREVSNNNFVVNFQVAW